MWLVRSQGLIPQAGLPYLARNNWAYRQRAEDCSRLYLLNHCLSWMRNGINRFRYRAVLMNEYFNYI
jgi:hypothetical protein